MKHDAAAMVSGAEITAEMTDAGVRELLAWLGDVVPESTRFVNEKIVNSLFCSMVSKERLDQAHLPTRVQRAIVKPYLPHIRS